MFLSVLIVSVFHLSISSDKFRTFILDVEDLTKELAETTLLNANLKEDLHQINETNNVLEARLDQMNETDSVLQAQVDQMNGTIISLQQQLTGKGSSGLETTFSHNNTVIRKRLATFPYQSGR